MIMSCWSPFHQAGTTVSALSLSSYLTYSTKDITMLMSLFQDYSSLGYALRNQLVTVDGGLDNSENLIAQYRAGTLNMDGIKSACCHLYKGRLVTISDNRGQFSVEVDFVKTLLTLSNRYFKNIVVDLAAGVNRNDTTDVINISDVVVVNLTQSEELLDTFFNGGLYPEMLKGKNVVYCISSYDANSHTTLRRIKKLYPATTKNLFCVPRNVKVMDAVNSGQFLEKFFLLCVSGEKNTKSVDDLYFVDSVKDLTSACVDIAI